jgi:hypothetical protein
MKLRDIKKDIEYVIGAFIDDCSLFVSVNPGKQTDDVAKIIEKAVDLYNVLRDKANHPEGKKATFFLALRKELLEKTDALYEELSAVVKKSVEAPVEEAPKAAKAPKAKKAATEERRNQQPRNLPLRNPLQKRQLLRKLNNKFLIDIESYSPGPQRLREGFL